MKKVKAFLLRDNKGILIEVAKYAHKKRRSLNEQILLVLEFYLREKNNGESN